MATLEKSRSDFPRLLLRVLFIFVSTLVLGGGIARAADVPPHLVGMARSLISQIDEADFAASGDPALAQRTADIVRLTRLRSWAGAPPKIAADPAKLAAPLGLDLSQDGHRAALDQLLAARDPAAQRDALSAVLQLTGRRQTLGDIGKLFHDALAEQLGPLRKRAKLEAESGQSIEIEWDPDTASVLARINLGDGQDEVVLHGGAAGKIVDGELVYDVEADAAPVTRITPSTQTEINANVFGVWRGSDGSQWMIRGGGEIEAAARAKIDPATLALEQIDRARQQLAALEKDKVYIWVDPQGGEVIQKKFKRLGPPFRYDRERSENMNKAEIAALKESISAAEKDLQLPPVKQHDPLQLKNNPAGTSRAVEIEVWEQSGRRYLYDEAAFDGKRLTASRTLRDVADIIDLPKWVIEGLIASWSPPEWIDFEAKFNPRDKSVRLEGSWWRLNVTYDPAYQNIEDIHTPYDKPVVLERENEEILLRIVDLEGRVKDVVRHDEPFRLQALFTKAPGGEQKALIKREGGDASVDLALAGTGSDPRLYESGILYGRSVQFAKRKDIDGLFVKERFVGEDEFDAKSAEWRKLTRASQSIAADLFKGNWQVSHANDGKNLNGVARISRAGTSARLALGLDDETRLYQSIDMRALRGSDPDPHFLEINFERVEAFGEEPISASAALLHEGQIIYFPTLARNFDAELDNAHASVGLDLKPMPEETIHVLLKSRGKEHLAGGWHEILENGDPGPGGQQTWVRGIDIAGVVVMEDQNKRDSPTTAYYPWGPEASAGSSQERTLFVFGKHLPTSRGDAVILNSLTEGVSYHTPRFPNEMPPKMVEDAWRKAAAVPRRGRVPTGQIVDEASQEADTALPSEGPAREADDVGLFITARFEKGAEPGVKALTLNAAPGVWLLDFADARGRAYFVDTPPIDGAPTDIFKSSDAGFLELELETPIPYKGPLVFSMSKDGTAQGEIPLNLLTGEASDGREGRVYRSPPLHFFRSDLENWAPPDEAGAIRFDVAPQADAPDPKQDNRFTATWTEPLRLAVPRPAEMRIIDEDDDEMSELWRKALERAAACYGGKVKIDPRATSEENSNFILTELWSFRGPFKKAEITIGDHAAAILIRDEFVQFSRALAQNYTEVAAYDSDLDTFIAAGITSAGRSDPLWRVMQNKVGDETYTAEQLLDVDRLASLRNEPREDAIAFRRDQVRVMLHNYVNSVLAAITRATDAWDCKVDELLVIAGQPAPMIAARTLPRLVTRREEGGRTFWEPDMVARAYVRTLHIKGAELRALSEYAAIDDTYKALALAAVGGGVGALASRLGYLGVAAYATVTADAIDMAYFGTKGVLDYQKGEAFYDFAKGASAVYGADYLEEAAAQRQSALGAAAGVLLPGIGIAGIPGTRFAGSLGDILQLRRVEHGAEIARRFSKIDAESLAKLSDAERLDLLAYVDEVKEAARIAQLPDALKKAAGLEKVGSAWELVKGAATSTGRRLDDADTSFLKAFDTHAANVQSQIKRGREIAARLDDFEGPALNRLTKAERADLAEYVKNVQFRQSALKSGDFGTSLAVPSAREADLARNFDDMTKAADEATSPPVISKIDPSVGPLPAPTAPPPGTIAKLDNLPSAPQPITPKTAAPVIDDALPKIPDDQASLTPPLPETKVIPSRPRVDDNGARGPPVDEPIVAKPGVADDLPTKIEPAPALIDDLPAKIEPQPGLADDLPTKIEPTPLNDPAVAKPTSNPQVDNNPAKPRPASDVDRTPIDQPAVVADDMPTKIEPPPDSNVTKDFPPYLQNAPPPHPQSPARVAEPSSKPEPVRWGPPLKPDTVIPLRGDPGGKPQIVVERHLNSGSSNAAYKLHPIPGEEGSWIARISKGTPDSLSNRVDQEGWRALEEVKGDAVLVPQRRGPFEADGAAVGQSNVDRVRLEVVEFVPYRAAEQIPAGGVPTPGQAIALDRAKRAFNAKGYVWLDNHPGNYGFKPRDPLNPDADDWQVVVIDPGGIVKLLDNGTEDVAAVARRFQTHLENPAPRVEEIMRKARANGDQKVRDLWSAYAHDDLIGEYGKHIDISRLGIDDPIDIGFRADGMVFYPNVRALSKIDGTDAIDDAYKALRAERSAPLSASPGQVKDANKTATLPPSDPGPIKSDPQSSPDMPPSDPASEKTFEYTYMEADVSAELSPGWPLVQKNAIDPKVRVTRPRPALNLQPETISKNWSGKGNGEFDVAGRALRPEIDVMNPVRPPLDLFNPKSSMPASKGLFADVRPLRDTTGQPNGYVSKTYGERRQWVEDGTAVVDPSTGRCTKPCWRSERVQTREEALAMAEDTLHGARLLEAVGVPQLDIVAHDLGAFPPRIVQRALGQNMPTTADGKVVEEVFADSKLVNKKLGPPFDKAFSELIGTLNSNSIFWEDMHLGNMIFQRVKRTDGTEYWRAGVSDTDRIDFFERPRAGREPNEWMRNFEVDPAWNNLKSRAPNQMLRDSEDAVIASLEHKGHVKWDPIRRCFVAVTIPIAALKAQLPGLQACQ